MPLSQLARAGFLTGIIDGLFSSVLVVVFYGSSVQRLFQGVAGVLLGPAALNGGWATAALGILMHFGVAFAWSIAFFVAIRQFARLRAVLVSPYGVAKIAAVYGPLIWMTMSLMVIPILTHRPPVISYRWWIQFFGHIPFVAMPIAGSLRSQEDR